MSKFNLKNYEKIDGNGHIERRLREQEDTTAPNVINEKQLEKYRASEPNQLTEKQLENNRTGGADVILERRLDNDRGDFEIKYRNSSAYEGDMNKLEEQRLSNDPVEDEKYEDASKTPNAFKWWEDVKSPDGLKLAEKKRYKAVKTAQYDDYDDGVLEENFPDLDAFSPPEDDFDILDMNDDIEEIPDGMMHIVDQKDIKSSTPGVYITVAYDTRDYSGDIWEIKRAVLKEILSQRPELGGLLSIDDIEVMEEFGNQGEAILKARGDKFKSVIPQSEEEDDEIDMEALQEEGDESTGFIFDEVTFEEKSVEGTRMAIGQIHVNIDVTDANQARVIDEALTFIEENHPNVDISEQALDTSKIKEGTIGYMSAISMPQSDFPIEDITSRAKEAVVTAEKKN